MRSYNQRCGLAKALDVIGDRWTLLIVRELLIRDGARYTDVRDGLPGIATNLLVDRLRELEAAGLVRREEAPPPVATTLFHLTERGLALEPALLELGRWGAPLLAEASPENAFEPHWLVLPLRLHLKDRRPREGLSSVEIISDGCGITATAEKGLVRVALGRSKAAAARLSGESLPLLKLLTGSLALSAAKRAGIRIEGDRRAVERIIGAVEDAG